MKLNVFWLVFISIIAHFQLHADPVVTNVRVAQRPGTTLVDITYDLSTTNIEEVDLLVSVSTNGGSSYDLPATHFTGLRMLSTGTSANNVIVWNMGADWTNQFSTNVWFRIIATDHLIPADMALIPPGSFSMGDALDGDTGALPVHTVYVSAFYMDRYDVTKALWDSVYQWAITNGYSFDNAGSGKAANHPVQTVSWYDAVKWCNARSEKEGRVPAYYTDAGLSARYRTGQVEPYANWSSGYRLPTEAEWEKAARGGLSGKRFPWGDTITHSQANYYSYSDYAYDISPTRGYHPSYNDGVTPYTSPVGSFAANGYGLYDMAGNVFQWCWDWYGSYANVSQSDPRGASSASDRVIRGGGWADYGWDCRSAVRCIFWPDSRYYGVGFRTVLAPGQP